MRRTMYGALALAVSAAFLLAVPASATLPKPSLPSPPKTGEPICKTVLVSAWTAPTINVSVGKHTVSVNVEGMTNKSITVCVSASASVSAQADLMAKLAVTLDPPKVKDIKGGCVIVNGSVTVMAGADVAADAAVDVSVTVNGNDATGKPISKNVSTPDLPIATDAGVPVAITACDP